MQFNTESKLARICFEWLNLHSSISRECQEASKSFGSIFLLSEYSTKKYCSLLLGLLVCGSNRRTLNRLDVWSWRVHFGSVRALGVSHSDGPKKHTVHGKSQIEGAAMKDPKEPSTGIIIVIVLYRNLRFQPGSSPN